ncbi:hypothetical protein F4778DRAFT_285695 [Xylariomycetidae sp. FL2044]|nr:hypothetical protein F4778DRAFT_285695 [Xylariomycetidae sp. FL2044]
MPETLREKVSKQLHGDDANPSQLGDPISIKAEQSDNIPTENAKGAQTTGGPGGDDNKDSNPSRDAAAKKPEGGETLREKATKKLHGPDANPSQLGDPISMKAETSENAPTEEEEGAAKRDSKL